MSDDLLERLGALERENRPAAAWDEVLEGRRTAAEVVRQRRAQGDDAEELEALARASTPLDDAERKAWARRLRAAGAAGAPSTAASPPIDLAQQRARRSRWSLPSATVLVAAAAMLALWSWARPTPPVGEHAQAIPLPSFSLTVRNDTIDDVRGGGTSDGPARYRPSSVVHWMVSPEQPITGPLELGVVIEAEDGLACLARPAVTRASAEGVLEVRGTVQSVLGLTPGAWRIGFVVAAAGALPTAALDACPKVVQRDALARMADGAALQRAAVSRVEGYEIVVEPD